MQLYYMKKEKISLPVSTVILMIVTITYKAVLVVVGLGLVLFGQGFLHRYLTEILPVFYLGIGLNVFCVTAMLILVFHPALARTILVLGLKIVEKLHLMKRKESRLKKLEKELEQLNKEKEDIENQFQNLMSPSEIVRKQKELAVIVQKLEESESLWLELSEKLESIS